MFDKLEDLVKRLDEVMQELGNKSVPSRRLSLSLGPKYLAIFYLQLT